MLSVWQRLIEFKFGWGMRWTFSCWLQGGLTILPAINLVTNVGFGDEATHTRAYIPAANLPARTMGFPLRHPLIKGTHKNSNKHPSIIHFSFNKAATQYVKSILRRCAVENGMVPVGIHDYAFNADFPYLDHLSAKEMEKYMHIFKRSSVVRPIGRRVDAKRP